MASSSSSNQQNEGHHAFSGIETPRERRKVSESSRVFDVFINHRGPDVKETLARQLYNSLKDLEIGAFLDSEEMEPGNSFPSTIENAINSASAHIAIFSQKYAESAWCLEELVLMLQSTAKIFPVFYGVKPSDLRHIENGVYANAFTQYEKKKRYTEKLNGWKEALQSISFITGYEISNFNVGNCQMIVSAVQDEVKRRKRLYVAKHPVGLHKLVKDFERRCFDELVQDIPRQCGMDEGGKGKPQIVGIFGMGGVGKTTLAKELFNRKHSQYTQACFLFDVREAYSNNTFPYLQMKLVKDLFQQRPNFHCTEEGTSYIADCIERSDQLNFLIVVDDIDHVQQLDALLIMDMLKKSADILVIVTTRDVGVLIKTGIMTGYNLKGMDRRDARELFCWHAFDQPHPANDYESLVESFLRVCGGLPLSLQVIGRHVHGRDQSYWSSELNKVSKTLPRDIHRSLKISFDALDHEEKQIFMDVACFFVEGSKSIAMSVWEGSGWSAQSALEALKNKCLVEGGHGLRMHDHLRDLGREMANELSRPCRLWRPKDLEYLESMGFQNILAQTKGRCFHSFIDKTMNCRITYFLGESDISADTSTILLWLQLEGVSNYSSIPSWIPLQNLRCLIIRNLRLKTLWQNHIEAPTQLKELQEKIALHNSPRSLSDLSPRLKIIAGMSDLRNLVELNISGCPELEELPCFARQACFEKITILKCGKLQNITLPTKLVELEIEQCKELKTVTAVCDHCECLQLQESSTVARLSFLMRIKIELCNKLQTIQGFDKLHALESLQLFNCLELEELQCSARQTCLKNISIVRCGKLQNIQGINKLYALQSLQLFNCPELEELPCFARQTCLQKINILRSHKLQNITLPRKLVELEIQECRELKTVTVICDHSECEELHESSSVAGLSQKKERGKSVARLSFLKRITIQSCDKLQTIRGIHELHALQSLQLFNCPELVELPCFAGQTCLQKISILRCGKLQNITFPTKLVELEIQECTELKTMTVICDHSECQELQESSSVARLSQKKETRKSAARLSFLKRITIQTCKKLQIIRGIDELHAVESLHLFNCPELKELPCFSRQTCLEEISILGCGKLPKNIWNSEYKNAEKK